MSYPTTLIFRRDPLARAVRVLDADDLRVFVAITTLADADGCVLVHAERLAERLRFDVPTVLHALRRIAEADLVEHAPAHRLAIDHLELGPVFVRHDEPPANLPVVDA